jgi:hypothetical protein
VDERSRGPGDRGIVAGMTSETSRPLVSTQSDLEQMWRRLMTPLGFSTCSLWMVVVERHRPSPKILEIVELSEAPDEEDAEAIARLLEHLAEPDLSFAFLLSRPGGGRPNAADHAWARALYDACRRGGARVEVVHLAHDHDVYPLPLDDVLAEPA